MCWTLLVHAKIFHPACIHHALALHHAFTALSTFAIPSSASPHTRQRLWSLTTNRQTSKRPIRICVPSQLQFSSPTISEWSESTTATVQYNDLKNLRTRMFATDPPFHIFHDMAGRWTILEITFSIQTKTLLNTYGMFQFIIDAHLQGIKKLLDSPRMRYAGSSRYLTWKALRGDTK